MISFCIGCSELFYDDFGELVDFFEDEDVELRHFICDDCFFELIGEPFCLDILGQSTLFFTDEELEEFMEDLELKLA